MNKKLLFILIPIAVLLFAGMIALLVMLGGNTTPNTTENPTSTNAPINQIPSDNSPHVITENIVLTGEEIVVIKIAPIGQGNYKENKIILYPDGQVLNITSYEDIEYIELLKVDKLLFKKDWLIKISEII